MTAYIGYNNLFDTASTVTVTSAADGYPKENAYDWRLTDWWQAAAAGTVYVTLDMGSSVSADYWAIAGHDLYNNSGTIKPQYSSDNFSADINDFDTVQTPSDGDPLFRKVSSVSARYWRFEIASTGTASFIGHLCLGVVLTLPDGFRGVFTPPRYGRRNTLLNNRAEGGAFLGRSLLRQGFSFTLTQEFVTRTWLDTYYDALADHVETKPFFFSWDYENYPGDAVFCWVRDGALPRVTTRDLLWHPFSWECNGV